MPQCAVYVCEYFNETATGLDAVDFWDAPNTVRTANNGQTIPPLYCRMGRTQFKQNYGHVGVVESVSLADPGDGTKTYAYSAANRHGDEKIIRNSSLTEADIKKIVPAPFLGYVKYK